MYEIINAEIVNKITKIVEQWNTADLPWNPANPDRNIRATIAPWAIKSIRAGIERGAMIQIGKIAESIAAVLGVTDDADFHTIGEAAFRAYKNGQIVAAIDLIRK